MEKDRRDREAASGQADGQRGMTGRWVQVAAKPTKADRHAGRHIEWTHWERMLCRRPQRDTP